MGTYVIQFIHGLVYGLLLFLVASGLTLVFGMMSVLNIAHVSKSRIFPFPFPDNPIMIPLDKVAVSLRETGNPRCTGGK